MGFSCGSWWNGCREGLPKPGPTHSRPRKHGGHEECSVRRCWRPGSCKDSAGWERAETGRAGGKNGSDDGQRRFLLQTCSWCTHLPFFSALLHSVALFLRFSLFPSPDDDKIQRQEMVPALMAFEKDRTLKSLKSPVSLKNCRSPFSFLRFPPQAQQENQCFSSQRHIINFALPQQPLTEGSSIDTGWPKVMRTERNERIYARMNLSFHYTLWSYNRTEGTCYIHKSWALYFTSISLICTPYYFVMKDTSAKYVLVEAGIRLFCFSLPFMVLANTADSND